VLRGNQNDLVNGLDGLNDGTMPRKRRNMSLKSALPNHSVTSQKKTRWKYFKQRLLDYLIGKLVKYLGEVKEQLEEFAIVMPRQNAFESIAS
jgi:hypothetical protein